MSQEASIWQGAGLKDAVESVRARTRQLTNLHEFYKWSVCAGLVGLVTGVGAIAFNAILILTFAWFTWLRAALPLPWLLPLIPATGGLLVGVIRQVWMPEAFGSPCATDAMIDIIHRDKGRAKLRVSIVTIITAALTLGSGGSAGRECPTALIGTGFGSIVSGMVERFGLDRRLGFTLTADDVRTLAICGAAAGLGAVFRAPIGGALFAVSVLYIYGVEYDNILPAVIASLTAYLVFSSVYGFEPMFTAPFVWEFNVFDLVVLLVIGVAGSLVGLLWIKVFYGVFDRFRGLNVPDFLKPAIGGLLLGLLVLLVPRVWGMGYETIQQAIDYKVAFGVLLVLIFAKMIASALSIGSGGAGGVIAPSLFIGAAVGGSIGDMAMRLFPHAVVHPALYVIAGMGAVYASVGKVPLATAILLCEATRNYTMIIPLVIANTAGFLASGPATIYESQLGSASKEQVDVLRHLPVSDVIRGEPVMIDADVSVAELMSLIAKTHHHGFPVVDDGRLVGVASWKDVGGLSSETQKTLTVREIMSTPPVSLRASDTARLALDFLDARHIGRIVIVDDGRSDKVVGVLTKADLVHAYAKAL